MGEEKNKIKMCVAEQQASTTSITREAEGNNKNENIKNKKWKKIKIKKCYQTKGNYA